MISLLLKAAATVAAPMAGRGRFFLDQTGTPCVRKPDGTLLQFSAGEVTNVQLQEVADVAAGARSYAEAAQQTASQASNDAHDALALAMGVGGGWDICAFFKGAGATRPGGWGGDYSISASMRPLKDADVRGVRLWWPMGVPATITVMIYRAGPDLVAVAEQQFAPGEVADVLFENPLPVVAGESLLVCMYGGGVGTASVEGGAWFPPTMTLFNKGFMMTGAMFYVEGFGKPNMADQLTYRPCYWPIV